MPKYQRKDASVGPIKYYTFKCFLERSVSLSESFTACVIKEIEWRCEWKTLEAMTEVTSPLHLTVEKFEELEGGE